MSKDPYDWLSSSLKTIKRAKWYRSCQNLEGLPGPEVISDGKTLVNFASNDYLGLAGDERLIEAAVKATQSYGTGSTGSRLLTGHRALHRELEEAIALFKSTEDTLVFSSGYLANLGAITALVGKRDLILADRYNHSSLKNGVRLSGATWFEYGHNCLEELEVYLEQHRDQYRRCLIVTDSIFSMDGDLCQLPALLKIAEMYQCMVLIDEAHATGVIGARGSGCVEYFNCKQVNLVQVGTLSKALGSLGGYVTGSQELIDFLRNRAASWIYTTALSPGDTAAAIAAIKIITNSPKRVQNLDSNRRYFQQLLQNSTIDYLPSESPIIAIPCPNPQQALNWSGRLRKSGFWVPAIRPPTVPFSRLRISLMATHTPEQLHKLAYYLKEMKNLR